MWSYLHIVFFVQVHIWSKNLNLDLCGMWSWAKNWKGLHVFFQIPCILNNSLVSRIWWATYKLYIWNTLNSKIRSAIIYLSCLYNPTKSTELCVKVEEIERNSTINLQVFQYKYSNYSFLWKCDIILDQMASVYVHNKYFSSTQMNIWQNSICHEIESTNHAHCSVPFEMKLCVICFKICIFTSQWCLHVMTSLNVICSKENDFT